LTERCGNSDSRHRHAHGPCQQPLLHGISLDPGDPFRKTDDCRSRRAAAVPALPTLVAWIRDIAGSPSVLDASPVFSAYRAAVGTVTK
jgi:hypothetical protein